MTTLLEQGILSAKNGNKEAAKQILTQVLRDDNRNEQAWLWLSETVDTIGEQIECLEQVLIINPNNAIAQLAIKKLKAQPTKSLAPVSSPAATATASSMAAERRPFRLSEMPPQPIDQMAPALHNQATVGIPAGQLPAPNEGPAGPPQQVQHSNGLLKSGQFQQPATTNGLPRAKKDAVPDLESLPLLPVILFGTLSVTAIGGLLMIVMLLIFS